MSDSFNFNLPDVGEMVITRLCADIRLVEIMGEFCFDENSIDPPHIEFIPITLTNNNLICRH